MGEFLNSLNWSLSESKALVNYFLSRHEMNQIYLVKESKFQRISCKFSCYHQWKSQLHVNFAFLMHEMKLLLTFLSKDVINENRAITRVYKVKNLIKNEFIMSAYVIKKSRLLLRFFLVASFSSWGFRTMEKFIQHDKQQFTFFLPFLLVFLVISSVCSFLFLRTTSRDNFYGHRCPMFT